MATKSPSPDMESSRLKQYRLDHVIKTLPAMPPLKGKDIHITPDDSAWSPFFFKVSPKDLEHLKLLAGVPSAAADHPLYKAPLKEVAHYNLPSAERMNAKMSHAEEQSLYDMAHNILFSSHPPELLSKSPLSPVVDFMLKKADGMTVFAAQDLIVLDGQTVTFDKTATLYFNNVIVHGTGQIVISAQVKLVAETIQYLPN